MERKKQRRGLATLIHLLWEAADKVGPDPSWRHIAKGNRQKSQRGVLVRDKEKCSPWG